ncbi:SH3-domain-containing protein [Dichomitus squalens LYAD-421 SS1]|uniref:SH3-domain-containing protein n=1 Tax=Dichomitus squalens (strain LYAD-421) TaxID=732165 RepID=UPI000441504B|nr:SH3-domain-containing protein [Dichomitus squalens LYAD-421 SS1]EJF63093.1 SH3-domain-containing protein [Dichomitus squalens LYAD-421 SS1]
MVFARLTPQDKDAFFSLLDEYFASRPELFGNGGSGMTNGQRAAAASAVHQAFSAAPALAVAAPAVNGWRRPQQSATTDSPAEESTPVAGRVAAAAAALRAANGGPAAATPNQNGFPRPPPRRAPSSSEESATLGSEANKLVASRKFGDVDLSSGKNMFSSIRGSTAAKHAGPAQVAPPTPPAFKRNTEFAPPPRRVPSTGSSVTAASPTPPPALPRRQPTQEESGEWAEALYPYESDDPGDLPLEEGVRVLVVEKTSDDWWTGEIDGRRGLIPAAYVKVL